MQIVSHRLHTPEGEPIPFVATPNQGGSLTPRYLVMHYTAGTGAKASINWLANSAARASAHLVIGLDGTVTQLVPFDRVAWHAGPSRWDGLSGLNAHSIGIELDNAGRLERKGGRWCAWFGTALPDEEVMVGTHKHESRECGWHLYPAVQLDAALRVAEALVAAYELRDVVGHEDISPGRKTDPGPAFPMGSFRAHLLGRAEDALPVFRTRTALNIRIGPGTGNECLQGSPLPAGTRLEVLEEKGDWRFVNVMESGGTDSGTQGDVQGWVHGGFVERVS
jgi:N-acetylmuramoyl-L-alanine amidase